MDSRDRRRFAARVRGLLLVFLIGLGLVIGRTFKLQVHEHDSLAKMAREQYLNDVQVPARRGTIYDRNRTPLAVSVEVPSVYANPSEIVDPRKAARALAPLLDVELDTLYQRLASERLFVWLRRQITPEMESKVRALGLVGVGITKESKRFYPNRELAAHVLGFTGVDGHGLEGMEKTFDEALAGEPQVVEIERDARGRAVLLGGLDPDSRSHGDDVVLTLDASIQHAAEEALRRVVQTSKARSALAVALDAKTAEVLAMAVHPPFNANVAAETSASKRRNRAVTDVFEPGSTLKPIVLAAALDRKAVRPDAVFFCENGSFSIGKHTIRDSHPYGWLSLTGIIQKSSNIGAAKVGKLLGRQSMHEALAAYGFGQKTGIGLTGEAAGMLRSPAAWSDASVATISYGHGIAVTALQLAAATRVLAVDGVYRTPSIVVGAGQSPLIERRVVSNENARAMRKMMEAAVGPDGTGALATISGYRVAGKTGTAIKVDAVSGGYAHDKYVALFSGMVPSDDARVVISVVVDEPVGAHTGGEIAAPVFAEIGAAAMRALGVAPSVPLAAAPTLKVSEEPAREVALELAAESKKPIPEGGVPSFVGLTAREAMKQFVALGPGVDLVLDGSGKVVRQEPSAGSPQRGLTRMTLVLAE